MESVKRKVKEENIGDRKSSSATQTKTPLISAFTSRNTQYPPASRRTVRGGSIFEYCWTLTKCQVLFVYTFLHSFGIRAAHVIQYPSFLYTYHIASILHINPLLLLRTSAALNDLGAPQPRHRF